MQRVTWTELASASASGLSPFPRGPLGLATPPLWVIDVDDVEESQWTGPESLRLIQLLAGASAVLVGVARRPLTPASEPALAALTCTLAPEGPGTTWARSEDPDGDLALMERRILAAPAAAATLATALPVIDRLPVPEAMVVESAHYSMLLAGPEHAAWRARTPVKHVPRPSRPVLISRHCDELRVELNVPERRNAFNVWMRDGLLDALDVAAVDPDVRVVLTGRGRAFCSGGDLDEFGRRPDVVAAHSIRLARSVGLAIHRVSERVTVRIHGAAVGAGVELPAFAGQVLADDSAWFCLPELDLGLIPGAGGTVSLPRRIGRWRTAWMVLTGARVGVSTALEWGLVDGRA